jgi:hypothetical protein
VTKLSATVDGNLEEFDAEGALKIDKRRLIRSPP